MGIRTRLVRGQLAAVAVVLGAVLANAPAHRSAAAEPTTTVYLPNITKMLGGPDGWQTPFIVQNVGTAPADITMDFYGGGEGRFFKTRTVSGLAPRSSVVHDPNSDPDLGAGGAWSVVVKSFGSPIVALVNEHQNVRTADRQEALSYGGISGGATRVLLPYITKSAGGWLTTFIVQNLGTGFATVTVQFRSFDGSRTSTLPLSMAPGRSQFVDLRAGLTLADGVEYSAVLTSDQPIGVVVNAHDDAPGTPQPRGFSYNGVPATTGQDAFLPYLVRNVAGRSSRVIIENAGLTSATPAMSFSRLGIAEQFALQSFERLEPGAARSFDLGPETRFPDGEYSARVTGGQFAVAIATTGPGSAMGYTAISGAATTLYLPNVTRRLGGEAGWSTPIYLQSIAARTASLSWYRFSDGAFVSKTVVSMPGPYASVKIDPRETSALSDGTQYAVVVESDAGGVAAMVTELNFQGGDGAMQYEAFALAR
jgi:hypothetical protein